MIFGLHLVRSYCFSPKKQIIKILNQSNKSQSAKQNLDDLRVQTNLIKAENHQNESKTVNYAQVNNISTEFAARNENYIRDYY